MPVNEGEGDEGCSHGSLEESVFQLTMIQSVKMTILPSEVSI